MIAGRVRLLGTLALVIGLCGPAGTRASGLVSAILPPEAQPSGRVADPPGRYGVASGVWDGSGVPFVEMNGTRVRQAFRLPDAPGVLTDAIAMLSAGFADAGFDPVLSCTEQTCGGFDFRHRLEVLPLPAMYVDLGDFRYLSGRRSASDAASQALVAVLASASGGIVYLQIDVITPLEPAQSALPSPALPPVPPDPVPGVAVPAAGPDAPAAPRDAPASDTQPATPKATPDATPGSLGNAFAQSGQVVLEGVRFASGSSELVGADPPSLAALAAFIENMPEARIVLVGHTDATGSLEGNLAISRQRAQAVADRLVAGHGVDRARLAVQGAGFLAPRADNRTNGGRARNRRVTAVLLPSG